MVTKSTPQGGRAGRGDPRDVDAFTKGKDSVKGKGERVSEVRGRLLSRRQERTHGCWNNRNQRKNKGLEDVGQTIVRWDEKLSDDVNVGAVTLILSQFLQELVLTSIGDAEKMKAVVSHKESTVMIRGMRVSVRDFIKYR